MFRFFEFTKTLITEKLYSSGMNKIKMHEGRVVLARRNLLVKTLYLDSFGHVCVRFPILWKETVEWLKPKQKVRLALGEDGKSISITPKSLSPTSEKETEQKGGE